jgi:hypothetical protein
LNNIVNNENSHWSSFQMTYPTAPDTADELSDWSAASGGRFQYLSGYTISTPPIVLSSSAAIDPAGTYSGAGASAPTLAAGAAYIPGAGPASAAGDFVGSTAVPNASASTAGLTVASPQLTASPDTVNPNGAPAGYTYQAGATAYIEDPAGAYSPAGASAPIADLGGTYGAAASAPTTDPAGTYSSPYALTRLFLEDPQVGSAVSDTAADVVENLGALSADPNITAINASSGLVAVSAPIFLAYQPTLDEIVGGFDIHGAAAAITASLDQQDTIPGFLAPKSAGHDHLQFSPTMFGFSSAATQTADAQALLSNFVLGSPNTTITDLKGDTLTLNGVTIATLEANLGDFKFA